MAADLPHCQAKHAGSEEAPDSHRALREAKAVPNRFQWSNLKQLDGERDHKRQAGRERIGKWWVEITGSGLQAAFRFSDHNDTFRMSEWNVESGTKSQLSEDFYKRFQDVYEEEAGSVSEAIHKTIKQIKDEATDREA